jgi:hypothetical protein
MLFELIAVIAAGFAAGGAALVVRRLVLALPRWLVPVMAGGGMLATAISLEYGWYSRTRAALPAGIEVALTRENRAPWRPWSYAAPYIDGFIAVDRGGARTNEAVPGQRMIDLYVFGRWAPTQRLPAVFDCEWGRRADLVDGVTIASDGRLDGAAWRDTGLDDPVTRAACAGV